MQAMILAAGFGTRLLPHTLVRPKPLFPILNIPLLILTINRLKNFGFDHILVNCHHLGEQIQTSVQGIEGVTVIREDRILGTGGGLRNALYLMRDEPLLVTNGDIYHTVDFQQLYLFHIEHNAPVTLAMHDYPRFNSVYIAGDHVADFSEGERGDQLAFTGLHVIEPEILEPLPAGEESCIISRYKQVIKEGRQLKILRVDDCYWTDMGTPEDYLSLHGGLLQGIVPLWDELPPNYGAYCVSNRADLRGNSVIRDWCSVGCVQGKDVVVERSVIWDGVILENNCAYVDQLISANND